MKTRATIEIDKLKYPCHTQTHDQGQIILQIEKGN